jgi:hypothetical protein
VDWVAHGQEEEATGGEEEEERETNGERGRPVGEKDRERD